MKNVVRESVIGRSPTGKPVLSFENEKTAREYLACKPAHRIKLFKQVITEEEIAL